MPLTDVEVRILGALIEKEATTPDAYPLSLNALTTACNQTSNRDPVMDLSEDQVKWAVNSLRQQSLVRAVQTSGSRVMKFRHLVDEKLSLDRPAVAIMCVLMLRGAQTAGEIRSRTTRLAELTGADDIEGVLTQLAERGLAMQLPTRPGQREARYAQLLSGPSVAADEREAAVERVGAGLPVEARTQTDRVAALEATVERLERELGELRTRFEEFARQFG